ncbi:MAG: HupE/UreJ family protein [Acidobacteriota bacterium]
MTRALPTALSAALFGLALALSGLLAPDAYAHSTGENYVWLNVETRHLEGRFEIRLADLDRLGVTLTDAQAESPDAAREAVTTQRTSAEAYLRQHFEIRADGQPVPFDFTRADVAEAPGLGLFAQYFYRSADFNVPEQLDITNTILLGDEDKFHRSLLCIEYDRRSGKEYGEEFTALIFSAHQSEQTLDLTNIEGLLRVRDFVWQGVLHIWIGIDHVLFLIALLLTAVLVRKEDPPPHYEPVPDFKSAFIKIVTIVTTFTVAHSVTLSLAALDIISLSSRVVESIIALSIVLVAVNNIFPKVREGHWLVIFFFGLFHGMGFASVMGDLPFRMMHLVQVILAFNIGVELGQIVIVAVAFPILFLLRKSPIYRPVILNGGSAIIGLLALWWFIERAFAL